ncbi:MAG: hypothetical protein HRT61_17925 [Ekhidna sp.]|nr:hypothetical protein [Ekhidna sp.]
MKEKDAHAKTDHLSPSNLDQCQPVTAPQETKNLSNKEVEDKLEVYSRVGNRIERYVTFQKSKGKFKEEINKANDNRTKQDIYYAQGQRAGLSQAPHQVLRDDRDWKDQQARDAFMKDNKAEYNKEGLKKAFEKMHNKRVLNYDYNRNASKGRDQGMDRDK